MMSRAAQTHLAGRVFETPVLESGKIYFLVHLSVTLRVDFTNISRVAFVTAEPVSV